MSNATKILMGMSKAQLVMRCQDLIIALERCENWFESQAKVVSKGCRSPFDLMILRDERDACTEVLKDKQNDN